MTESQVQDLLREINGHLKLGLRVTDQQREDALVSEFPDHPRCTPRYLGRSHSREDYDTMIETTPNPDFRPAKEAKCPPLDERTLEVFKQLMEESFEAQKAKSKAAKAKRQRERLVKQKTFIDSFKRAQRYLGLRSTPPTNPLTSTGSSAAVDPVGVPSLVPMESLTLLLGTACTFRLRPVRSVRLRRCRVL